ncbi:Sodium-dependent neutral amino acid transporter B(0)AT3 [Folsomia candida]|uniref:Sodium-dependent neutral amino acid transporter B(0)AT3 n=1 Tax=Folsomia candida TaxID=158441 RepID=A0A226DQH1_FOLCA|nr:Sodium-dependent neutral amino acid transporter B(0)AT3 [Folsomia candida]
MSWIYRLFGLAHPPDLPDSNPYPRRGSHGLHQESGHVLQKAASSTPEIRMTDSSTPESLEQVASLQGQQSVEGEVGNGGGEGDVVVEPEPERDTWGSKLGYILTLVGYAVGFGNIWRFPFLMHSNGGVAFLIPYTVMVAFAGIPLFFLELAVGQRLRKGALGSWNEISPYLGGLGISCGLVCYSVELYYNTLVAWVFLYFFDSFRSQLPWTNCSTIKKWKDEPVDNMTGYSDECGASNQASKYYWYRRMLDVSNDITQPGNFNPWMLLALTVSWLLVLGILIKGIKSSEKVVYFTALFPYWKTLYDPKVWLAAGSQIFFSLGVAYGCLIVFASYLPSNNNCYRDAVSVSIINCATSLFAAIVLFPVFGAIGKRKFKHCLEDRVLETLKNLAIINDNDALDQDKRANLTKLYSVLPIEFGNITNLIYHNATPAFNMPVNISLGQKFNCSLENLTRDSGSGTGLVFIGFAEAVLHMGFFPPFWSFMFFLMLLTLGIDSSFGTLEGAIAVLIDLKVLKVPRWAITCIVTGSLFVLSLMFCWGWGVYIQAFLDQCYTLPVTQKPGIIALGYIIWLGIIIWVPAQALLKTFGMSLLREEKPAYFPEEELRAERQLGENDDEEFDRMDQIVMGKSIGDFQAQYRSSKSNLNTLDTSLAPEPPVSAVDMVKTPSKENKSNV